MAVPLNEELERKIFEDLQSAFSDFQFFDNLAAVPLRRAIADSNRIEINVKTTKKVADRYFDEDSFKTPDQRLVWAQLQIIFKTCYVLIFSTHARQQHLKWHDVNTLITYYPDFAKLHDSDELQLLLNFRNMLRMTIELIPARLNKQLILKIAARLEGSHNEYITGGGQKPAVQRRVQIYEKEGGINSEPRPGRKRPQRHQEGAIPQPKRSISSFSEKKARSVQLNSDDIEAIVCPPPYVFPSYSALLTGEVAPVVSVDNAPHTYSGLQRCSLSALTEAAVQVMELDRANQRRMDPSTGTAEGYGATGGQYLSDGYSYGYSLPAHSSSSSVRSSLDAAAAAGQRYSFPLNNNSSSSSNDHDPCGGGGMAGSSGGCFAAGDLTSFSFGSGTAGQSAMR